MNDILVYSETDIDGFDVDELQVYMQKQLAWYKPMSPQYNQTIQDVMNLVTNGLEWTIKTSSYRTKMYVKTPTYIVDFYQPSKFCVRLELPEDRLHWRIGQSTLCLDKNLNYGLFDNTTNTFDRMFETFTSPDKAEQELLHEKKYIALALDQDEVYQIKEFCRLLKEENICNKN